MLTGQISDLIGAFETGKVSRRQLVAGIGAMVAAAAGIPSVAAAAGRKREGDAEDPTFKAVGLNHIALDVTDPDRSADWYAKHMGLEPWSRSDRSVFMGFGNAFLAMFRADQPGLNHYCYTINNYDPADAMKTLKAAGVAPRRQENRVYFDDPDGITVQVAAPND